MISLGYRACIIAGSLIILSVFERISPFFSGREFKVSHTFNNLLLGGLTGFIGVFFTGGPVPALDSGYFKAHGVLGLVPIPPNLFFFVCIVVFDFWMYVWHRLNHENPVLWRFHRVHHSDPKVDASSGVRFHPGEIILSWIVRIPIIFLVGIPLRFVLAYEILMAPFIFFHHSNIRFPERLDNAYRLFFASPHMHRIHHSVKQAETDSNYGSILSFWDRIFRSIRIRPDPENINQGLPEFSQPKWQSIPGLLKMPAA